VPVTSFDIMSAQ